MDIQRLKTLLEQDWRDAVISPDHIYGDRFTKYISKNPLSEDDRTQLLLTIRKLGDNYASIK
jgi:hypothetical protein